MLAQRKLVEMMDNSPRVLQQRALRDAIHSSPRMLAQHHPVGALSGREAKPAADAITPAETSPAQRKEKTNNTGQSVPPQRTAPAAGAPVQRQIKKPHSQEVFGRLTTPMIMSRFPYPPSTAMVNEIKNLHAEPPPAYTWSAAVKEATRRIKHTGRKVTGRTNRLNDHTDLISYAGSFGVAVPKVTTYITKHSSVFDAALTQVEFAQGDFSFGPSMTDNQMKTVVTDTMMAMPATLTRTMSAFNELADAQVLAHSVVGSAWKGNQFEQWVDANVFPTLKFRAKFKNSALAQDRTCDGYDHATHTLWDYKHYSGNVPSDQADDYDTILKNGIASTTGETPTKVCYLFSDKNAAKTNKWLNTTYGFEVWYVKTGMPPTPVQLY